MKYTQNIGCYSDKEKSIICFEPTVDNETFQCLLVDKEKFIQFLSENNLTIIWISIGEKRPNTGQNYNFLGTMEISQYYYLENNEICCGRTNVTHLNKNHEQKKFEI